MLTITKAQFDRFQDEADADLQAAALAHVREELAPLVEPMSATALESWIAKGLARGRELGFEDTRELLAYIDAGLLLQRIDFDMSPDHAWAGEILQNRFMTPFEKSLALLDLAWVEHTAQG